MVMKMKAIIKAVCVGCGAEYNYSDFKALYDYDSENVLCKYCRGELFEFYEKDIELPN